MMNKSASLQSGVSNRAASAENLEELLDREAIRQLPILYCHFVRAKNAEAIVDLYSEDGEFDMPAYADHGGRTSGREALREMLTQQLANLDPWPFTHNHVVELTGTDTAKGFVYAEIRMGSRNLKLVYLGVYEDQYVKVGGIWKFKSRKLKTTPLPE